MTQDQHKLEPCPFCGSPASMESQFGREWWAQCTNIQCNAADGTIHHDAQAALTWWNRRAHLQQRPLPVREGATHYVPYHRERDDFDWDALHRAEDHDDRRYDMDYGWEWVGIVAPSPSLPVRQEPTDFTRRVGELLAKVPQPPKAITWEHGVALLTELQTIAVDMRAASSPSVQNMGEGETGKDGVDGPRAADLLEGAPEVCEGCGAIEARNESHHYACPRGAETSARKRLDAVPAHLRGLVQLQGHDEHPERCGKCRKPWLCEQKGCMDKAASEPAPGVLAVDPLEKLRGCPLSCFDYGQCKANMHGRPSDCVGAPFPTRGVKEGHLG